MLSVQFGAVQVVWAFLCCRAGIDERRGPRRAPARRGEEEPRDEDKAYQPDMPAEKGQPRAEPGLLRGSGDNYDRCQCKNSDNYRYGALDQRGNDICHS